MTEEVTDAILPCPFCGAAGKPQYHNHSMTWHVRCPDWKCPGKTSCEDQSIAIAAWNTRATLDPTGEKA